MNRTILTIAVMAACLSMAAVSSFAWGVVYEDNHIQMRNGESRQFYTGLQNMVGSEDYQVTVTITDGIDIATLHQTNFSLPAGTSKLPIYVSLNIPKEGFKDSYRVALKYILAGSTSTGQVGLKTEKIVFINVGVVEGTPEPEPDPDPDPDPDPLYDNNDGSDNPSPTPDPDPAPNPIPDPDPDVIIYPDAPNDPNTDITVKDGDELVGDGTGGIVLNVAEPFRFPVEWVVVIIIAGVVIYMLLPPNEDDQDASNSQYGNPYAIQQ